MLYHNGETGTYCIAFGFTSVRGDTSYLCCIDKPPRMRERMGRDGDEGHINAHPDANPGGTHQISPCILQRISFSLLIHINHITVCYG